MNSSSNNSILCSGDKASNNNYCFGSKLRRYKIQEGVLLANVNKCFLLNPEDNNGQIKYLNDIIQMKKYFSKLKDNFQEIKNLFEDIALKINDQEYFEKTDIDELKRDILELETKMRTAKEYVTNELQALRNEEITLTEKSESLETSSSEERKVIRRNVPQIKGYKEIVPSPVRVLINSPLKCSEVQQFQDFMRNSPNRYGGWNEYNHNIFVQIWNKNYGDNNMMVAVKSFEDTLSYKDFKDEVLHKISGSSLDSIDSHSKWYSEYLYFKLNQQNALNKWKENKRKIKPSRKARPIQTDDTMLDDILKSPANTKLCRKQKHSNMMEQNINNRRNPISDLFNERLMKHRENRNEKFTSSINDLSNEGSITVSNSEEVQGQKFDMPRFLRPTKQWLIKQKSEKDTYEFNETVERIGKLRTPLWRLNLRE